jgi:hypothetical protein
VHVEIGGDRLIDRVKEVPKLDRPMAVMQFPDDLPGLHN